MSGAMGLARARGRWRSGAARRGRRSIDSVSLLAMRVWRWMSVSSSRRRLFSLRLPAKKKKRGAMIS